MRSTVPSRVFSGLCLCSVLLPAALIFAPRLRGESWPLFRHDARHGAVTGETIRPPLFLQWRFRPLHPPRPAWPSPGEELPRMHEDDVFPAVVAGDAAYIAAGLEDRVYAVDLAEGRIRWTFDTEGPVRFAPAWWEDKVYFGSDDGRAYCVDARTGACLWKYRAGPSAEKVIGNGRVISLWPVRTSVLVEDGKAFFCAGVFPYEGIYVCCLDARNGTEIWKNDTVGDRAHELEYGGISPHGYLLASDRVLYVPSGRAMPAAFDRDTGRFLFYASPGGHRGGSFALLDGDRLIAGVDEEGRPAKMIYDARTGRRKGEAFAWFPGLDLVVTAERSYILTREGVLAVDRAAYKEAVKRERAAAKERAALKARLSKLRAQRKTAPESEKDRLDGEMEKAAARIMELEAMVKEARASCRLWHHAGPGLSTLCMAGRVLYAGGRDTVRALDAATGAPLWEAEVEGTVRALAAAEGYLLVSTDAGPVYCFGREKPAAPKVLEPHPVLQPFPEDEWTGAYDSAVERILERVDTDRGWILVADSGEGRLAYLLAVRSRFRILGLEQDPERLARAREKLTLAGLWGDRVVVEPWRMEDLPPWFANVVTADAMIRTGRPKFSEPGVDRVLRPYGGVFITCNAGEASRAGARAWKRRVRGPLEEAGEWTQLYGNPENTACSMDRLVKGPLGVLWFGDPGPRAMVDRHGRAAGPLFMDGRVFVQGGEVVMALDAYNGTLLWERAIPGAVRVRVDVDGGNLACTHEALYVAVEDRCLRLDPSSGRTVREYPLPGGGEAGSRRWGYVSARKGLLLGTAAFPLKRPYAALLKDLADLEKGTWKPAAEVPPEVLERWRRDPAFGARLAAWRAAHPAPDAELMAEFKRAGTLWHPMADFPSWGSQQSPRGALTRRIMAGDALFALDAETGTVRWIHRGRQIPNIAITLGEDTVFLVEGEPSEEARAVAEADRKRWIAAGTYMEGTEARLVRPAERDVRVVKALDLATGRLRWERPLDLTGCGGDKMGSALAKGVLLFFGNFSNHDTRYFLDGKLSWRRIVALDAAEGRLLWSRPLGYLRRPLVLGDTLIVEPRACDLFTGELRTRLHPVSGRPVPWEFLRPGHCCSVTSASASTLFYRSYWTAMYDVEDDKGISLFGAIRPGCWLDIIPAGGLMIMPESSAGCTCSFPLRCSLVLAPKPWKGTDNWTVFVCHGEEKPVRRLDLNFGAPGDLRDEDGTLWLAYPRPPAVSGIGYGDYAMKIDLDLQGGKGMRVFQGDYRGKTVPGDRRTWLYTSGVEGVEAIRVPLREKGKGDRGPSRYMVRLGFCALSGDRPGARIFDVEIQGRPVLQGFDPSTAGGGTGHAVVRTFRDVPAEDALEIRFNPRGDGKALPLVNFLQVSAMDADRSAAPAGRPGERAATASSRASYSWGSK